MPRLSPTDRTRLLAPGTTVARRPPPGKPAYGDLNPHHRGVVPPYDQTLPTNLGWFPVAWRDGVTTTCSCNDVIVVAESASRSDVA